MEPNTRETGSTAPRFDRVRAALCGQMAQCTKATGSTAKLMAWAGSSTLTVTSTMAAGRMTKPTVSASIAILMAPSIVEIGRKTSKMGTDANPGPTVHLMKATTLKAGSTDKAASPGPTKAPTKGSSSKITSRDKVSIDLLSSI